jgi:hypothetical protein
MAQKAKEAGLKPGSKIERLYTWVKNEMVNDRLLFTNEHVGRMMSELNVRHQQVWNMLQRLEEAHGVIVRKKTKGEKGLTISFPAPDKKSEGEKAPKPAHRLAKPRTARKKAQTEEPLAAVTAPVNFTDDDMIALLREEVDALTQELKWKSALITQLTRKGGR